MIDPWVGSDWGKPGNAIGGVRLLVLGESAHAAEHEVGSAPVDLLVKNVREYINENPKWRFYRIATALITGKNTAELDQRARAAAWESIAFSNYVPVVAANYSRQRPTREMFAQGAEPFQQLMGRLMPEAIVVLGFDTWGWMMHGLGLPGKHWDKPETPFARVGPAIAARLSHPSRGFAYERWRPIVSELLKRATPGRNTP